jgi:hypothetical protein
MPAVAGPETPSAEDFGVIVSMMKSPTETLIFNGSHQAHPSLTIITPKEAQCTYTNRIPIFCKQE